MREAATETPAWLRRSVREAVSKNDTILTDAMLAAGEDVTDAALWRQRKSRFLQLLIQSAVTAKASIESAGEVTG
jgi:hypothetical protein